MGVAQEQAERLEALRGLIERLTAPDLTLTDAKVLRGRVSDLLEPGDRCVRQHPFAPAANVIPSPDRYDLARHDTWSAHSTIRVAG